MNSKQFMTLCNNVTKTQYWSTIQLGKHRLTKVVIERYNSFTFLSETELSDAIKQLKAFDINLLWSRAFWGLKQSESISAVATEPYNTLLRIKSAE